MNREGTDRIGYLDFTWNPVVGCTHGCPWCWARRQAKRQRKNCQTCYDFVPHLHPERLDEPLKKRKPFVIGAVFMGDLFDPALPSQAVLDVLRVMEAADWHTFVVLTKQPWRASEFAIAPNVVLGVSVEDQPSADRLIPELLACPAAKRIVSIEPMRGPVDLHAFLVPQKVRDGYSEVLSRYPSDGPYPPHLRLRKSLDGVVLGGQTGSTKEGALRCGEYAVQMDPDWVRKVRDQCAAAGVPFYFQSWGALAPADQARWDGKGWMLDGRTHDEVPWTAGPRRGACPPGRA